MLLFGRNRLRRDFLDGLEDLLDDLRVQGCAAVERNHDPPATFCVDPMTALGPQPNEIRFHQHRLGLRGSKTQHLRHGLRRPW